ncbi:3485_t:CDS:2, partial [Dentiscutata erythropus]
VDNSPINAKMHSNYSRSIYNSRSLVRPKSGAMSRGTPFDTPGQLKSKSIGTPFDVPTQIRQLTPTNITSNSKDIVTESEVSTKDNFITDYNNNSTDSVVVIAQDNVPTTSGTQKFSSTSENFSEEFIEKEKGSVDIGDIGNALSQGSNSNPSDNESECTPGQTEDFLKKTAKRHKRSNSIASVTSTATDGSGVSGGSGSSTKKRKSFKIRKLNNKKRTKPWEDDPEEEIPHDDAVVTIAELCKDIKRGRKSSTFKELELAKYLKAHQRRAKRLKLDDLNECDESNPDDEIRKKSNEDQLLEDSQKDNDLQDSDHLEENFEADNQENSDENDNYDNEYIEDGEDSEGNYEEMGEYDQEINGEELNDEEETNNEIGNDKPIFMKRRTFTNRGSRFINDDGQYVVREDPNEHRNVFNPEGMEVIEEDKFSHIVNSHSYAKLTTITKLQSLSQWGTDFEIISQKSFNNTKTRIQIKNKYKRERKINPERVNEALDTRIPISMFKYF